MLFIQEIQRKKLIALLVLASLVLFPWTISAQEKVVPSSKDNVIFSYSPLVKNAAPAVVNIYTSKRVQVRSSPLLADPFFGQFFGGNSLFNQGLGVTREKVVNSLGSGVVIDPDGLIITNFHVAGEDTDIQVVLSDKREFKAEPVLIDKRSDLALLKVETHGEKLPYLQINDSDNLEVGDIVLAIGNPFGVGQTVTSGIVSALARTTVGVSDFEFFIQTDASINPGNSGGALVDMNGKMVGINTAIYTKTGTSNGIGFATPSIMVKVLLNNYRQGSNKVLRPWLGASTQNLTQDLAGAAGLKIPSGVLIRGVYPGSAAEKAGLKTGDIIMKIDDYDVSDEQSLKFRVATYAIGSEAEFTILRYGREKDLIVRMEAPGEYPPRETTLVSGDNPLSGATIVNISPVVADEMGINDYKGVIVTKIEKGSVASRFMAAGDIVIGINGVEPKSVKHLMKLLDAVTRGWKVQLRRGDKFINIDVRI